MSDNRMIDWGKGTWADEPRRPRPSGPKWTDVSLVAPEPKDQRCRLCGGKRRRGERDDEWIADIGVVLEAPQVRRRRGDGGESIIEADEPEWGRRHVACTPADWWVLEQVAGIDVEGLTEADVATIASTPDAPLTASAAGYREGKPWGWVTDSLRAALIATERRVRTRDLPRRCAEGRCASCGRGRSTAWTRLRGWSWPDGSKAATCADCTDALRGVDPFDQETVRLAAFALMAGMRRSRMTLPTARLFRLFVETPGADDRHGDDLPWTYNRAALDVLREEAQTSNPALVLDPIRRKIASARLAARVREAEEAERAADPVARLWG